MSLPSAFRLDARGALKFCQVAIRAAHPAQHLGLKTNKQLIVSLLNWAQQQRKISDVSSYPFLRK
jgi:hypothetical protein